VIDGGVIDSSNADAPAVDAMMAAPLAYLRSDHDRRLDPSDDASRHGHAHGCVRQRRPVRSLHHPDRPHVGGRGALGAGNANGSAIGGNSRRQKRSSA
jgi:hypothetical protein